MAKLGLLDDPFRTADEAADFLAARTGVEFHDVAVLLGSGWGNASSLMGQTTSSLSAGEIPGFYDSGIPGHSGTVSSLVLPDGKRALVISARNHLYEGKGVRSVVHPVRTALACGVTVMVLTNGAGGLRENWVPGQPVLISDHINLTAETPIEGPKFIDLTDLYSPRLREIARAVSPSLEEGVYVQFRGPNYETPAEVQMAKSMGGHIVGMSTALEAIAAREAGIEILGLSLITNLAAGISPQPLSHQEVITIGKSAEPVVSRLLADIVHAL